MKKILSYFYPLTKKIETEKNGILELTYYNGRKLLDSASTNYSYGSLQRILKFGLEKTDMRQTNSILLLGLGGGSVVQTLRRDFGFNGNITAIEADKVVLNIALNEFGLSEDTKLETLHTDAFLYVKEACREFGLVIADLFIDNKVPPVVYSEEFWKNVHRIQPANGQLLFNAAVHPQEEAISPLENTLKKFYKIRRYNAVDGTNTIFTGTKAGSRRE